VNRRLQLFARGLNLGDRRFAEGGSFTRARGVELAPGMPRTFYAGARVRVGR
jgi:hypothetical protein